MGGEQNASGHISVLLDEAVEALVNDVDGFYVDGTFGRGGHSREILKRLSNKASLLGIDKDREAIAVGQQLAADDTRFDVCQGSFAEMEQQVSDKGVAGQVSGILLDLGVSSPQLDQAERGFSFMQDGPLDMRMNDEQGESAADWINRAEEKEIVWVLKEYGEERFARRMAKAILAERELKPFLTTQHLANVISEANPAWEKGKHPATRAFQGIRIYINNELQDLEQALSQSLELLAIGGRLVVISFHSLEDRLVKRFMRQQAQGQQLPRGLPVMDEQLNRRLKLQGKAIKASAAELENNPRARSAVMRVAEKIA